MRQQPLTRPMILQAKNSLAKKVDTYTNAMHTKSGGTRCAHRPRAIVLPIKAPLRLRVGGARWALADNSQSSPSRTV